MDRMDNLEISQEMIDRLVDGELEDPARSVIIRRLEHDTVLCRQIALAFLEHQAWREVFSEHCSPSIVAEKQANLPPGLPQELSQIQRSSVGSPRCDSENLATLNSASTIETTWRHPKLVTLLWISAIAASFFFAFLGSWYVQSLMLQKTFPTDTAASKPGGALLAGGDSTGPTKGEDSSASPSHLEMVSVPLPIDESGTWATFEVPMISSSGGPIMEMIPAGMVPAEILESLVAEGHTVEQERRFVPVALPDGRESVVPIDQVRIRFVGGSKR